MAEEKIKLDTREARTDLTSRECSKLIGSTIGGLLLMASRKAIRDAVIWWAENFDRAFPAE
jgi:hypothetical protein